MLIRPLARRSSWGGKNYMQIVFVVTPHLRIRRKSEEAKEMHHSRRGNSQKTGDDSIEQVFWLRFLRVPSVSVSVGCRARDRVDRIGLKGGRRLFVIPHFFTNVSHS